MTTYCKIKCVSSEAMCLNFLYFFAGAMCFGIRGPFFKHERARVKLQRHDLNFSYNMVMSPTIVFLMFATISCNPN